MESCEDSKYLDQKSLTELQYLKQLVEEAILRKNKIQCKCRGFYKDPNCLIHQTLHSK